jgi:hypothetical protein
MEHSTGVLLMRVMLARRKHRVFPALTLLTPLTLLGLLALLTCASCAQREVRTLISPPNFASLPATTAAVPKGSTLKIHLRDGRLYLLTDWATSTSSSGPSVSGTGRLLGPNREILQQGSFTVPVDSVALFESDELRPSPAIAAMTVVTIASAALTFACVSNPKSCFGSCPTFYAWDEGELRLVAEGFSSSVAPSLIATDVDALVHARAPGPWFELRMRNEAYETHVVDQADLLVAPRGPGERVFAVANGGSSGAFRRAGVPVAPSIARADEGDCLETLRALDDRERTSLADSTRLDASEVIELVFPDVGATDTGLVLTCRQSLLTTYLFYQALAWLGRSAGEWIARLERGDEGTLARIREPGRLLGGIEILVPGSASGDDTTWVRAGTVCETGPLAADTRVVALPPAARGERTIRLRLTRGAWRIDCANLVALGEAVDPIRVRPSAVMRGSEPDTSALAALLDPRRSVVTLPGDELVLRYRLPDTSAEQEIFLESRGYYLEWMRPEWLAEENPLRAAALFYDPQGTLRSLAPAYKQVEPDMERAFWSSRYAPR